MLFATTAISIDKFVKSKEVMGLLDFMVKRLEPSFLDQMQMNVLDNLSQLAILWTLAPGASCHGLGVRAGTTIKRLLGFSFESILKVANSTTNATANTTALL